VRNAGILVGVVVAYLLAGVGCYQPELRDCTVQCSAATDCTGGQVCRADGWCAMPSVESCPASGAGVDSGAGADASTGTSMPDAPDQALCQQGCTNGTCMAGVCVIDCSTPFSCTGGDIKCPGTLPCRVVCGERSCAKKILCEKAASCEVQCNGDFSCQDEVICNANRCKVDCLGASACKKTKCGSSCACDVTCTGLGSCTDPNECSETACRLGEGCSSLLTGCNDC
jgi:hypothetical protein